MKGGGKMNLNKAAVFGILFFASLSFVSAQYQYGMMDSNGQFYRSGMMGSDNQFYPTDQYAGYGGMMGFGNFGFMWIFASIIWILIIIALILGILWLARQLQNGGKKRK